MMQNEFEGELKWISPDKIININKEDEIGRFFLVLGLIFNDLKDLTFFEKLVIDTYKKPEETDCSSHAGSYGGMMIHTNRLIAGVINEFFKFLSKNEEVLKSFKFQEILKKIPVNERENWNAIVAASIDSSLKKSDFLKTLFLIRSNFTYHYYQADKVLKRGFESRFYNEDINDRNKYAYYSVDENNDGVRYFFSDAAVEEALFLTVGKGEKKKIKDDVSIEKYKLRIGSTISVLLITINSLLKIFLQSRRNS